MIQPDRLFEKILARIKVYEDSDKINPVGENDECLYIYKTDDTLQYCLIGQILVDIDFFRNTGKNSEELFNQYDGAAASALFMEIAGKSGEMQLIAEFLDELQAQADRMTYHPIHRPVPRSWSRAIEAFKNTEIYNSSISRFSMV